jgi:undecaprenyl-diphosphatase
MTFMDASLLAVVEGLTEYLPISSTGHIILASAALGIPASSFTTYFTVMVQFGAILAVFVEYFRFLISHWRIYPVLFVAFLPAAIIGLALNKVIDRALGSTMIVGASLLLGGVVLVFTDRIFPAARAKHNHVETVSFRQAIIVGFFQCLALIPGMSRSASTIWGGLSVRMDQKTATQFSFLLALPTLTAATFYKGYKGFPTFTGDDWKILIWANILSFIVGWLTIRAFIHYVARHSFRVFGFYRIALGIVTLTACWLFGLQ